MIGLVYGANGKLTRSQELGLKIATPIGNLFGQSIFGWLADKWGRKRMYGIELVISEFYFSSIEPHGRCAAKLLGLTTFRL